MPRDVVRFLVTKGLDARLNMQYRELTIFFSDIASFTTICESLRAKELYMLLSSYFEEMVKIILERLNCDFAILVHCFPHILSLLPPSSRSRLNYSQIILLLAAKGHSSSTSEMPSSPCGTRRWNWRTTRVWASAAR